MVVGGTIAFILDNIIPGKFNYFKKASQKDLLLVIASYWLFYYDLYFAIFGTEFLFHAKHRLSMSILIYVISFEYLNNWPTSMLV